VSNNYQNLGAVISRRAVDGSLLWEQTFPHFGQGSKPTNVVELDNGDIVIGFMGREIVYGMRMDFYLLRLSGDDGSIVWQKDIDGDREQYCESIVRTSDGGIVVAGYTSSYGYKPFIIKTDIDGNLIPLTNY